MVMLGLKSASYWTHSAATAASCAEEKSNPNGSTQQDDHEVQGGVPCSDRGGVAHLGHSLRRVVILQLWVHALLHFVLAQSWSGLEQKFSGQICFSFTRNDTGRALKHMLGMGNGAYIPR